MRVPQGRAKGQIMGKIFISYASEDRPLANDIHERLQQAGHDVFFDESNLKPSDAYDQVIQNKMARSDIMLFLCSNHSLAPGRYTLTELEMAKTIWKKPQGRVLPILLGDIDFDDLPSYLKGLSAYRQKGDPVSEIAHMANTLVRNRRRRKRAIWGGGIAASLALAVTGYMVGSGMAGDGTALNNLAGNGEQPVGAMVQREALAPPKPEMDIGLAVLSITDGMIENPSDFDDAKFNRPDIWSFCPGAPFNILNKSSETIFLNLGIAQTGFGSELGPIEAGGFKQINAPEEAELGFVLMDMSTKNFFYYAELSQADCE